MPIPVLHAMAQNGNTKAAANTTAPVREAKYHDCTKPGCSGRCPIKVIAHKSGTDSPAVCRECGKKFSVPAWSKAKYGTGKKPQAPKANPTRMEAEMAKMRQQIATLQSQGSNKATPNGAGTGTGEARPKPNVADLDKYQSMLELAKAVGNNELVKSAQKALDEAKAAEKDIPLTSSFKQLEVERKKHDRAAALVVQTRAKLAEQEAAALEASKQYLRTSDKCDKLLQAAGRGKPDASKAQALSEALLPAPLGLPEEQQTVWLQMANDAAARLAAEVKRLFEAQFPGSLPQPMEGVEEARANKWARRRSASEEPLRNGESGRARAPGSRSRGPPRAEMFQQGHRVASSEATGANDTTGGDTNSVVAPTPVEDAMATVATSADEGPGQGSAAVNSAEASTSLPADDPLLVDRAKAELELALARAAEAQSQSA